MVSTIVRAEAMRARSSSLYTRLRELGWISVRLHAQSDVLRHQASALREQSAALRSALARSARRR